MKLGLSPLQAGNFEETIQECERAEAAGFDSIWLGEHHNHPVLYPTPLLALAAIASRTRRLRLGTGVLLLPLYHQAVRGQTALMTGVLLLPQGLGAALTMPFAGKLTDQIGPGRVVLVGLALDVTGMLGYTQVSATTSYWYLEIALLIMGLGMGCTMMPAMSAAYQTISHAAASMSTRVASPSPRAPVRRTRCSSRCCATPATRC